MISTPFIAIRPEEGFSKPETNISNEVFPAPDGPTILTESPFLITNETSFNILILLDLVSRVSESFLISTAFMNYLSKILIIIALFYSQPAFCSTQIVMFGDSLIAGYGLAAKDSLPAQLQNKFISDNKDVVVHNLGISGDTTFGGVSRVQSVVYLNPDVVIIVLGGNDLLRRIDPEQTYDNLDKIITAIQRTKAVIFLMQMNAPLNYGLDFKNKFESVFPKIVKKHNIKKLPFILDGIVMDQKLMLPDGIHPNALGVAKIVDNIYPVISD